jgi:5-methylcytosine-specific restriction endonuclease McrA
MYLQNKYTKCYYNIIDRAKSRDLSKETYTEKHHIIPKSLGGLNNKDNLVKLTAKEHRLAHILLPRMTIDPLHTKSMWYALWMMLRTKNTNQQRKISKGSAFEVAKIKVAENSSQLHKGKTVSTETREKLSKSCQGRPSPNKGKAMSEDQKQKLSVAHTGKIITPETVAKILESRKHYRHSEKTKQKISDSNKGKIIVVSEETKKKISESSKGRSNTWLTGKPAHNRGIPHTKETVEKLKGPKSKYQCLHCNKLIGGKANYNRWHGDNCKTIFSIPTSPV